MKDEGYRKLLHPPATPNMSRSSLFQINYCRLLFLSALSFTAAPLT